MVMAVMADGSWRPGWRGTITPGMTWSIILAAAHDPGAGGRARPCLAGGGGGRRPRPRPPAAHGPLRGRGAVCTGVFLARAAAASPKKTWRDAHLVLNRNKARSREAVSTRGGESSSRPV